MEALSDVVVVLVRTQGPINLGLVARACGNLGVAELRLVAPLCDPQDDEARKFANHERDRLLAAAPVFDSVGAATADRQLVVGTTAIINARLLMYGAALQPYFQHQPRWFRLLAPHYLVDQTYALATARHDLDRPDRFRRYWLTMGAVLGTSWMFAMATGVLAGPVLPQISAFDFAVPAVFIGLLVPRLRERAARRPALLAAIAAILASPLPHGLGLLVGALVGLSPHFIRSES